MNDINLRNHAHKFIFRKNAILNLEQFNESWVTNLEQTPLNRSQQLPAPYKRLIDEIKEN